jgi:hypothetical protein
MNREQFNASLVHEEPPDGLSVPLMALWWDAKQDWTRAHALVDELETHEGMAVHAYLQADACIGTSKGERCCLTRVFEVERALQNSGQNVFSLCFVSRKATPQRAPAILHRVWDD